MDLTSLSLVPHGASGWQFDSALDPDGSVATTLLRLLPFTAACGLVGADLAEQHDDALVLGPCPRVGFVSVYGGELCQHALVECREGHGGFQ